MMTFTEITPDDDVTLARHIMLEEGLDRLSIVEDGLVVGVLVFSAELERASGPVSVYMRDAADAVEPLSASQSSA